MLLKLENVLCNGVRLREYTLLLNTAKYQKAANCPALLCFQQLITSQLQAASPLHSAGALPPDSRYIGSCSTLAVSLRLCSTICSIF